MWLDVPTPPTMPRPVQRPIVRPSTGGAGVGIFLLTFLDLLARANTTAEGEPSWADWLTNPQEASVRAKTAKMCRTCCEIVSREGEKTIRKVGPNLDKVSPKTKDSAKRFRRRKVTRQPAW